MHESIQDVQHCLLLFHCFCRDWNSPVNKLRQENLKALREVLLDVGRPFSCHYGAIIGLTTFGTKVKCCSILQAYFVDLAVNVTYLFHLHHSLLILQAVEDILIPQLPPYWKHLQNYINDPSSSPVKVDAFKVYGALMVSVA